VPTLILATPSRREPFIYPCGHTGWLRAERSDSDREIAVEAYHRAQLPCPACLRPGAPAPTPIRGTTR
jgi:hypothetical protein